MMKRLFLTIIFATFMGVALAFSVFASGEPVASGSAGEEITWSIYNKNSQDANTPYYQIVFSGKGALIGYTDEGKVISYGSRDKSQLAPWRDYIFEAVVEEGIEEIGSGGLGFLYSLRVVELPKSVTKIGNAAFESNSALERVAVAGNRTFLGADLSLITSIGAYAFDGCSSLRYVKMCPDYVGALPNESFKNCDSLETFVVPSGVSGLSGTFKNCENLKTIYFEGDPKISSNAFASANTDDLTLYTETENGNVCNFAVSNVIGFSNSVPDIRSDFYCDDENVVDIGKCAEDVFYRIVKENGTYVMYTFGTGETMSSISFSGDTVGYGSIKKVYWYKHKDLITKVVLSENIKTMTALACGFMSKLTHVEITENLTGITGACFEASGNFGCIYKRGNEPIEGHLDLTGIMRLGSYTFDGCRGIKTVEFAPYVSTTYIGTELFKNCVNLESVKLPYNLNEVRKYAFRNCDKLKTIAFFGDVAIDKDAFYQCDGIESIAGLRGSMAEAFANEHGISFIMPNVLRVYLDGEKIMETDIVSGNYFSPPLIDGKIFMLYRDEECTVPLDYSKPVSESMDIYARFLVSHTGFMVRTEDYNGLRSLYEFDLISAEGDSLYDIKEMGSIASLERDIRGTTSMTYDDNHIFRNPVVLDNKFVGKLVSFPKGTSAQFAHTATGYEKNGSLDARSATEPLYFRGYAVLRHKESGELYEIYTDVISATLCEKSAKTAELGAGTLGADELEFLNASAKASYDRDMLYTKEELLEYINTMYEDIDHILYGQQINIGNANSLASYLASFRDETGDYPAVVGIDQGTINRSSLSEEETAIFRADLVEYAKRGGIITLSFHMDNPNNESLYCRGSLGKGDAFDTLMTTGSDTNASLMRSLATAAETLRYLEEAGVPVLWRPLHEMNGNWFWWCTVQGGKVIDGEYVARLWRYIYNYFEVECGLENLIWVYSPNYTNNTSVTSGAQHVMYCYPGDEYVDMVGCDWYTASGNYKDIDGEGKSYSSIASTGKPACITEFGPSGDLLPVNDGEHPYKAMKQLQLMKDIAYKMGHSMVYILNWTSHWSIYKMGDSNDFMADPMIYGANETYTYLIAKKLC